MPRVVVVTPNPALDVTYHVPRQELAETIRVTTVHRRPGGKGLNVARVLRVLGVDPTVVLPLGGATGDWIGQRLSGEGVTPIVVPLEQETRMTVTVVDGEIHPTLWAESGPPVDSRTWATLVSRTARACEGGGLLVVSGSFPPTVDGAQAAELVEAGHRAGARVVVDTSGQHLLAAADAGADLLKPNIDELRTATGVDGLIVGIEALLRRGTKTVIVSRGRDGVSAMHRGRFWHQPSVPDVSGNPTGAGDAATAGIVAALTRGAGLAECLRDAALVGAAAVRSSGAGEVALVDVEALRRRLPPGLPPVHVLSAP